MMNEKHPDLFPGEQGLQAYYERIDGHQTVAAMSAVLDAEPWQLPSRLTYAKRILASEADRPDDLIFRLAYRSDNDYEDREDRIDPVELTQQKCEALYEILDTAVAHGHLRESPYFIIGFYNEAQGGRGGLSIEETRARLTQSLEAAQQAAQRAVDSVAAAELRRHAENYEAFLSLKRPQRYKSIGRIIFDLLRG